MKHVVRVALVMFLVACASDEDKLVELKDKVRAAEADVSRYDVTPYELMQRDTVAAKDATRIRRWFDSIQEDSLPAARLRLELANRNYNQFMNGK